MQPLTRRIRKASTSSGAEAKQADPHDHVGGTDVAERRVPASGATRDGRILGNVAWWAVTSRRDD